MDCFISIGLLSVFWPCDILAVAGRDDPCTAAVTPLDDQDICSDPDGSS